MGNKRKTTASYDITKPNTNTCNPINPGNNQGGSSQNNFNGGSVEEIMELQQVQVVV